MSIPSNPAASGTSALEIVARCSSSNEYATNTPAVAAYAIDLETAKSIIELSGIVRKHGLYKVERFDYRADWLASEPDDGEDGDEEGGESGFRSECDCLNVSSDQYWMTCLEKHGDADITSEHQSISDLAAHFGLDPEQAGKAALPLDGKKAATNKARRLAEHLRTKHGFTLKHTNALDALAHAEGASNRHAFIAGLASSPAAADKPATPATAIRNEIYVVTIRHDHGSENRVATTYELARGAVADFARQYWHEIASDKDPDALSDDEAIDAYFNAENPESYEIDSMPLISR